MRLAYALELVLALAVGCATARYVHRSEVEIASMEAEGGPIRPFYWDEWLRIAGLGLVPGVAVAGGLGLAMEVLRRRSPPAWGVGRRAWAMAAIVVGYTVVLGRASSCIYMKRVSGSWPAFESLARDAVVSASEKWTGLGGAILALFVVDRLSRPSAAAVDAREWAGRVFGALVVALSILEVLIWSLYFDRE